MNETSRNLSAAVSSLAQATVNQQLEIDILGEAITNLADIVRFDLSTMEWDEYTAAPAVTVALEILFDAYQGNHG